MFTRISEQSAVKTTNSELTRVHEDEHGDVTWSDSDPLGWQRVASIDCVCGRILSTDPGESQGRRGVWSVQPALLLRPRREFTQPSLRPDRYELWDP